LVRRGCARPRRRCFPAVRGSGSRQPRPADGGDGGHLVDCTRGGRFPARAGGAAVLSTQRWTRTPRARLGSGHDGRPRAPRSGGGACLTRCRSRTTPLSGIFRRRRSLVGGDRSTGVASLASTLVHASPPCSEMRDMGAGSSLRSGRLTRCAGIGTTP
jgi:hypothetical protein